MEPKEKQQEQEKEQEKEKEKVEEDNVFVDRPHEEVEGGYYDELGFYRTPNGSFWDEDGNYFNHEGYDSKGGHYDKFGIYRQGNKDFNEELQVYTSDIYGNPEAVEISKKIVMEEIHNEHMSKVIDEKYKDFKDIEEEEDEGKSITSTPMKSEKSPFKGDINECFEGNDENDDINKLFN